MDLSNPIYPSLGKHVGEHSGESGMSLMSLACTRPIQYTLEPAPNFPPESTFLGAPFLGEHNLNTLTPILINFGRQEEESQLEISCSFGVSGTCGEGGAFCHVTKLMNQFRKYKAILGGSMVWFVGIQPQNELHFPGSCQSLV